MSGWNYIFVPSFAERWHHEKKAKESNRKSKSSKMRVNNEIYLEQLEYTIENLKIKIKKHEWNNSLKEELLKKESILKELKK